jgi:predicted ABC-type ATPase
MNANASKNVVMVGGPNGAGKTSWAVRRLRPDFGVDEFVNADEIARGLNPLDPEGNAIAAGRLMLARLRELVSAKQSFGFETTCSGRGHVRLLQDCRKAGYLTTLIFLWLPTAAAALERVARRVHRGGHRIPDDVVVRRHAAGLLYMHTVYLPIVDEAFIYDNADGSGILIAERRENAQLVVHDSDRWNRILETRQ